MRRDGVMNSNADAAELNNGMRVRGWVVDGAHSEESVFVLKDVFRHVEE
jgi:hypothetical protein